MVLYVKEANVQTAKREHIRNGYIRQAGHSYHVCTGKNVCEWVLENEETVEQHKELLKKQCSQLLRYWTKGSKTEVIGTGAQGTAFLVTGASNGASFFQSIVESEQVSNVVKNDKAQYGSKLAEKLDNKFVIKIAFVTDYTDHKMAISENLAQLHMNNQRLEVMNGVRLSRPLNGLDFSPVICGGFSLDNWKLRKDDGKKAEAKQFPNVTLRVTVMEYIQGVTLLNYVTKQKKDKKLPLSTYVKIECALILLWRSGLIHTDLHMGNIILTNVGQDDETVTIIDYGLAIKIEYATQKHAKIVKRMSTLMNKYGNSNYDDFLLDEFQEGKYKNIARWVMAIRSYPYLNLDSYLLSSVMAKYVDCTSQDLLRERRNMLGYKSII